MGEGVDYAGDHPSPTGLREVGKIFAVRYFGPGGAWKLATAAEVAELNAAGLAVVTNAEGVEDGLLGGFDVGAQWAGLADRAARAAGMPVDRPIYLSVDFDARYSHWPAIADALRGAAEVIGLDRVGVYGSYDVVTWAKHDDVARWYWQTYAWSGGKWATHNHIEQYRNGVSLVGGTVDLDRSKESDFGQWKAGKDMALRDMLAEDVIPNREWRSDFATNKTVKLSYYLTSNWDLAHDTNATIKEAVRAVREVRDLVITTRGSVDMSPVVDALTSVSARLDTLTNAPLIDAVAVAAAIAAHPEIAETLASAVARQLSAIRLDVSLSGSAAGQITPPAL